VDSYDFAAYGKLNVELLSLSSPIVEPQPLDPGTLGRGRVKDRPGEEDHTTLPIDRGEGQGTAGNKIADCGWEVTSNHISDVFIDPNEDQDLRTVELQFGDGLISIEEYRGFKMLGIHGRTDPLVKDVFIASQLSQGIQYAGDALPTAVHRVIWTDIPNDPSIEVGNMNRINFNHDGRSSHKDQCALIVHDGGWDNILWGYTFGVYENEAPDIPCNITSIDIYTIKINNDAGNYSDQCTRCTIGHEVGHGVFMSHYNYDNEHGWFSMMVIPGTVPQHIMFTSTPTWYGIYDMDDIVLFY